ncbi:DUF1294 domain-containing protein [Glacieibacterium frigidum]|uniref:DUF1294 domain-containing protein n=2 Tax=Glacieibacterium frigidum TaxID=2593303 RepID=A0A552UJG5_9SPHN|nr:DUF1294 domain-containing protein [Glacieibacterium frigidum]
MVNATAYFLFCDDKARAATRRYRVSEFRLLLVAACGGGPGAIMAQRVIRHKTRKQPFADMLMLIVGIQIGAVIGLGLLYMALHADHTATVAYTLAPPRIATA